MAGIASELQNTHLGGSHTHIEGGSFFIIKLIFRFFMFHWPSEAVALNTTSRLAYSYKSVLFGNGLLADRVCGIFFDLCSTCSLRHALESVYYVLGL